MPSIQVKLPTIQCAIALRTGNPHQVAFNRPFQILPFFDVIGDNEHLVVWGSDSLMLDTTKYEYNAWHNIVEGVFKDYLKRILECDTIPQRGMFFTGGFV